MIGSRGKIAIATLVVLVAFAGLLSMGMGAFSDTGMRDAMTSSMLMNLAMTGIGLMLVWLGLRYLDWLARFNFRQFIQVASENDPYLAVYLGLRFIGVCLLVGLLLS